MVLTGELPTCLAITKAHVANLYINLHALQGAVAKSRVSSTFKNHVTWLLLATIVTSYILDR